MNRNLKPGQWSRRHKKCLECGTTSAPHQGKGYCKVCYHRVYAREAYRAWKKEATQAAVARQRAMNLANVRAYRERQRELSKKKPKK